MPNTNANAYDRIRPHTNAYQIQIQLQTHIHKQMQMQTQTHLHLHIHRQKQAQTHTHKQAGKPCGDGRAGVLAPAPQREQTQAISQGFSTFSTELSTRLSRPVSPSDFLANVHRTFSENLEDFSKKGLHFQPIVLSYYQQVGTPHCRVLKIQEKEVLQYETVSFAGSRRGQAGRG